MIEAKLRVGFLMGQSQHNTLRTMTETIAQQFRDSGHTADVYDLLSSASVDQLEAKFRERAFDLMVAFQGWGLNFFDEGPNLFDRAQVPYVTILGDHPMYHASRLKHLSSRNGVLVQEEEHIEFVRRIAGNTCICGLGSITDTRDYGRRVPLEERDVGLLFMGSGGDPEAARANLGHGNASLRPLLFNLLEIRTARAPIRATDALRDVLEARGIAPESVPSALQSRILDDVERIVRAERRHRIIRTIKTTPLTIWGPDWPAVYDTLPNVTVRREGYPTGAAAACRSRLLLNIFPDEFSTGHDRISLARATGTPLLTETNAFVDPWLVQRGAAAGFWPGESIDDLATSLLADPERLVTMTKCADSLGDQSAVLPAVETIMNAYTAIRTLSALQVAGRLADHA